VTGLFLYAVSSDGKRKICIATIRNDQRLGPTVASSGTIETRVVEVPHWMHCLAPVRLAARYKPRRAPFVSGEHAMPRIAMH
jgi:hypothetical protein